jgi:hypothetical protein
VICPKCGEDNSDNFRFCGMCGNVLEARVEARRPSGAPVPNLPLPPLPNITSAPEPPPPPHQPGANQPSPSQPSSNLPTMDALRDTAFSGLDSFFEPEKPKNGAGRILLLVLLLAALGGAGWWTYTNYLGTTGSDKAEVSTSGASDAPAEKPAPRPAIRDAAPSPSPDAGSSKAVVPEEPSENAGPASDTSQKTVGAESKSAVETKPLPPTPVAHPKAAPPKKLEAKRESRATSAKAPPAPVPVDTGDAAFRKGEAYLYGRGAPENCDEAVKNLKAASAKSNAKARSAFGTMYATGHCVPRDLPTSYSWFALALRVDPNNQILEKDLTAVWNQMTPPERQMTTKMKQ